MKSELIAASYAAMTTQKKMVGLSGAYETNSYSMAGSDHV
jgi:hypothetical protein